MVYTEEKVAAVKTRSRVMVRANFILETTNRIVIENRESDLVN